jgi:glycosyltransferase involved in cell wall biosynthesis
VLILSGLLFFPRGGSAQVALALARELPAHGCEVTVVSGSTGSGLGDASAFYEGLDVHAVDFSAGDAPMQPSYEDRPGAPDRCFARLDDSEYSSHVDAWARALEKAGAADADVLHLHHLTPLNEAAARIAPDVPVVGDLHGTELLMLERIAAGAPPSWSHADAWARRMRRWARDCERLFVHTDREIERAVGLLGVDPQTCVVVPNGFDPRRFRPGVVDRQAFWHRQLVERPQGWGPGLPVGSVTYDDSEVAALTESVVLVAVGRFTEVKRLGLLVRAFELAQRSTGRATALVLVGGHPGEWEGEHPLDVVAAGRAENVFLAGWHDHDAMPEFLNAADVQVLASVREQFGLVLVEGMACGLPAIAVDRFGPGELIEDGRTGWLVPPDDEAALADAIVATVDDGEERARRGIAAHRAATERWSWPALSIGIAQVFEDAAGSDVGSGHAASPVLPA